MREECDAIIQLKPPKSVNDCSSFYGKVDFLALLHKGLGKCLISIYQLQKKKTNFNGLKSVEKDLDHREKLLIQPPVSCQQQMISSD